MLGVLDLEVENGKINLMQGFLQEIKSGDIKPDPKVQRLVEQILRELKMILGTYLRDAVIQYFK